MQNVAIPSLPFYTTRAGKAIVISSCSRDLQAAPGRVQLLMAPRRLAFYYPPITGGLWKAQEHGLPQRWVRAGWCGGSAGILWEPGLPLLIVCGQVWCGHPIINTFTARSYTPFFPPFWGVGGWVGGLFPSKMSLEKRLLWPKYCFWGLFKNSRLPANQAESWTASNKQTGWSLWWRCHVLAYGVSSCWCLCEVK